MTPDDFGTIEDENTDLFIPPLPEPDGEQYSLDFGPTRLSMSSDAAKTLGLGYHFGMGADSKGSSYYEQMLGSPNPEIEKIEREAAAHAQDVRDLDLQRKMLDSMLKAGAPVDDFTKSFINQMGRGGINDPELFFEKKLSDTVLNTIFSTDTLLQDRFIEQAEQDPDKNYFDMEVGAKINAKQQMALDTVKRIEQLRANKSWGGAALDFGEQLIPFWSWYRMTNVGEKLANSPFMLGSNLEQQVINFYQMPPSQAREYLNSIMDLADRNVYDAEALANALVSYASLDRIFANLISVADLATITPIGLGFRALAEPASTAASVSKSVLNSFSVAKGFSVKTLANATNSPLLMKMGLKQRFDELARTAAPEDLTGKFREATTILSPELTAHGFASRYGQAASDEAVQVLTAQRDVLLNKIVNTVGVDRLDEGSPALLEALEKNAEKIIREHNHLPVHSLDVRPVNEKSLTTVRYQDLIIGDPRVIRTEAADAGKVTVPARTQTPLEGRGENPLLVRNPREEMLEANTSRPEKLILSEDNTVYEVYGGKTVVAGETEVRASNSTRFVKDNDVTRALRNNTPEALGLDPAAKVRLGVREAWPEGEQPRNRLYVIWDEGPNKGQIVTTPESPKGFFAELTNKPRKGDIPVESIDIAGRVFRVGQPIVDIETIGKKMNKLRPVDIDKRAFVKGGAFPFKAVSANDDLIEVSFGAKGMIGFTTKEEAENTARVFLNMTGGFDVIEDGGKFYIRKRYTIDESATSIKEKLVESTGQPQEASLAGTFLDYLRSADYKLGPRDAEQMKKAVFGGSHMVDMMKVATQPLAKLSKQERNTLFKLINYQTAYVDPKLGVHGVHSRTVGDFIKDYTDMFQTPPSANQAIAYMNFRQVQDIDFIIRNLSLYRDLAIAGVSNWRINRLNELLPGVLDPAAADFQAKHITRQQFEANIRNNPAHEFPDIVIFDPQNPNRNNRFNSFTAKNVFSRLNELEKEGYIFLNLTSTGSETTRSALKDLPHFDGKPINYLIAKSRDVSSVGLPIETIPYRAGFHVGYEAPWMLSLPRIRISGDDKTNKFVRYSGDFNIAALNSTADAKRAERVFGEAQKRLRAVVDLESTVGAGLKGRSKVSALKNDANYQKALKDYKDYLKKEMPMSDRDFKKIFKDGSKWDMDLLNAPILARRQGTDTVTFNKLADKYSGRGTFVDTRNSIHDPLGGALNFKWARERNLPVSEVDFNSKTPRMVQPHYIDAYKSVNNSAKTLMFGRYMDDMKHRLANEYVERFKDVLDMPIDEMRRNPYSALLSAKILDAVPAGERALAKNMRRTVMEVLGMKTETQRSLDFIKQHVADLIYNRYGENGLRKAEKAFDLVDNLTFGLLSDPVKLARNVAFHTKLGFFNPAQLFLQMQSINHSFAVLGPIKGAEAMKYGLFAYRMRNMSRVQREAVTRKFANKLNLDRRQVMEALDAFEATGFNHVGRETAVLDDYLDAKILLSRGEQLAEKGTMFFRHGEEISRTIAWFGSYREWRMANPSAVFDDNAIGKVLARADDLTGNMSSASKASWQTGIMSVPTQFWAYQARLMEQFLGKGKIENKWRALAWYGLMYGVPVGIGGTTVGAVWPIHESIRSYLLSEGYDVDSNQVSKFMMNGLQEYLINMTGQTDLNISERWGPGGNSVIRDLWKGDKAVLEALSGVSGTTVFGLLKDASPFLAMITKGAHVTEADVHEFLSNISTYNQTRRALMSMTTGSYISRSGQVLLRDGMKFTDSAMMGLTGAIPNKVTDLYSMMSDQKAFNREKGQVAVDAKKEYRLMIEAMHDGNMETARKHGARFKLMTDGLFNVIELSKLEREAMDGRYIDMAQRVHEKMLEMQRTKQDKRGVVETFTEGRK